MSANSLPILNGYCFGIILKYLDIVDHVNFARSCKLFRNIFQAWSANRYEIFNFKSNDLDIDYVEDFFKLVGAAINTLNFYQSADAERNDLSIISKFCINIEDIRFYELHDDKGITDDFCTCVERMKTLRRIYIRLDTIDERKMRALQRLPALTKLFVNCKFIEGQLLCEFKNLKQLILYCCNLQNQWIIDICKKIVNLKELQLIRYRNLSTEVFLQMLAHCHHLEELSFTCNSHSEYELVAQLPKLKVLKLFTYDKTPIRQELFIDLVDLKAKQLKQLTLTAESSSYLLDFKVNRSNAIEIGFLDELRVLELCSGIKHSCLSYLRTLSHLETLTIMFSNIEAGDLLAMIWFCPELRVIHIRSCPRITNTFVLAATQLLPVCRKDDLPPLQLYLIDYASRDICLHPQYLAVKKLLKINFSVPLEDHNIQIYDF